MTFTSTTAKQPSHAVNARYSTTEPTQHKPCSVHIHTMAQHPGLVYSYPPALYPLTEATSPSHGLAWHDVAHLAASIDKQRLQVALVQQHAEVQSAQTAHLSQQMTTMIALLSELRSQRRANKPADEADSDDGEEAMLELDELRRWKRDFGAEQTRALIDRVDELTNQVGRLKLALASSCRCKRALVAVDPQSQ